MESRLPTPQRTVIFHYHLFKNAGTSLDEILKRNFPGKWVTQEFPAQPAENRKLAADWIKQRPEAVCFSSHTAMLPPPTVVGVRVLPVIFVRHPLDRIASAYSFERNQGGNSLGATLARNTTLAGYIETRLSLGRDRQCRDFHTERFAAMFPGTGEDELERALRAVDVLPFVGVVEFFDESMARLQKWLASEGFEGLDLQPVARNVSQDPSVTLTQRMHKLADDIGEDIFRELERANAADIALYDAVIARFTREVRQEPIERI